MRSRRNASPSVGLLVLYLFIIFFFILKVCTHVQCSRVCFLTGASLFAKQRNPQRRRRSPRLAVRLQYFRSDKISAKTRGARPSDDPFDAHVNCFYDFSIPGGARTVPFLASPSLAYRPDSVRRWPRVELVNPTRIRVRNFTKLSSKPYRDRTGSLVVFLAFN